jgi:hypothetical protein
MKKNALLRYVSSPESLNLPTLALKIAATNPRSQSGSRVHNGCYDTGIPLGSKRDGRFPPLTAVNVPGSLKGDGSIACPGVNVKGGMIDMITPIKPLRKTNAEPSISPLYLTVYIEKS